MKLRNKIRLGCLVGINALSRNIHFTKDKGSCLFKGTLVSRFPKCGKQVERGCYSKSGHIWVNFAFRFGRVYVGSVPSRVYEILGRFSCLGTNFMT